MAEQLTPERIAQVEAAIADGQSHREIARSLGVDRHTINKYFPGTGWGHHESGQFGAAIRYANNGRR